MYVYFIWKEYKSPKREVEGTTPPWGSDLPGWERIKEIHFTVIGNIKKAKTKLKQVQISLKGKPRPKNKRSTYFALF